MTRSWGTARRWGAPARGEAAPRGSRPRTACIVVHNDYLVDPRVRREAQALVSDGWALDVVCLRAQGEAFTETCDGARIHRVPLRRHRGRGLAIYLLEYAAFFVLSVLYLSWLGLRRRYDLVQAHNVPDFLVFSALLPRLLGARIVLDIRDPLPDLYASKFGGSQSHPVVRLTRWIEARSTTFADHVLTPGEPSRRRLLARSVPPQKVTNVLNSADPRLFPLLRRSGARTGRRDRFTLVYHGGLFRRYGLDVAIKAVARLRSEVPELRFRIGGYGEEAERLQRLIEELALPDRVSFEGWIPMVQVPAFVAGADLGVVPYRQDPFTDLVYPTKAFEYIAMGVPVIMSGLAGVVELFGDVPDLFFAPDDVEGLARHILRLYRDPERLCRLTQATQRSYLPYSWEHQRGAYLALMRRLASAGRREATVSVPGVSHGSPSGGRG